jgi:cytochrome P450
VSTERIEDFDALAPEDFDSPYALFADLRSRCPVAHSGAWGGFWSFMRYADVATAASDFRTYTTTVQNVVPKLAFTGRRAPLHLDPPDHTAYRRAISPLLTREAVQRLEEPIRRFAIELLTPLLKQQLCDICEDFSSRLPVAVFAEWMNMPAELVDTLRETARAYVYAVQRFNGEMVKATSYKLYDMARTLIAQRKQTPLDPERDITSALLAVTEAGQPLPDEMIVGAVRQILVVGIVAPNVMIGSICVHLSRFPDLQAQLRNNLHLVPNAVEEYLRLFTPYRGFARTATRDVTVNDVLIRQGEPIALNYSSANRDDSVFPNADQFILNRPNINDHLAFGRGPHNCPGAWLARLELTIALEEILARTRHFEVAGPVEVTLCPEIGALSVPLRLEPAY